MNTRFRIHGCLVLGCAAALLFAGSSTGTSQSSRQSSGEKPRTRAKAAPGPFPTAYRTTDGRRAVIGDNTATNGGWSFNNPHMNSCWIVDDFKFKGYDTLYLMPTRSEVKVPAGEQAVHQIATTNLVNELARSLTAQGLFGGVVTSEADIKPGLRVLRMENTITEFRKGKASSRLWAGEYGAGQPILRVRIRMTDGDKIVFAGEVRRTGVSARARMIGSSMKDEEIQLEDIRSLVLDLADFMAAIAGRYDAQK